MAGQVETRLREMGLTVPDAPPVAGDYVPFVRTGALLFVSGQIAKGPDGLLTGVLGADAALEHGRAAAQICALNLLAQVKAACGGDLDQVRRVVKLTGFVASAPSFTDQPKVIDAASAVMAGAFAEAGRHARAAVGSSALPLGVSVEIEGVFELA